MVGALLGTGVLTVADARRKGPRARLGRTRALQGYTGISQLLASESLGGFVQNRFLRLHPRDLMQ